MDDSVTMTAAARDRLEAEVEEMEGPGRRAVAERISIAREWGDLKENAEYHAAKEEAAMLEAKITRMRHQLRVAEIVEEASGAEGAGMGSTVTYRDEQAGKERTFQLVPAAEAAPGDGRLSIDSPVGQVLSGAKEGDELTISAPNGDRAITVTAVAHA